MRNEELQAEHDEIWRQIYERQKRTRERNLVNTPSYDCEKANLCLSLDDEFILQPISQAGSSNNALNLS